MTRRRTALLICRGPARPLLALVLALAVVGCGGDGEVGSAGSSEAEGEVGGPRYESPETGIAIASVPAGFEVLGFSNGALRLSHASGARMAVSTESPELGGVNLVEAVQTHKADVLARESGDYKGQTELMSQFGSAYVSRGRYSEGGAPMEESSTFLLHPQGDRILRIDYVYPAGEDSAARLQDELFTVLAEVEDLGTPAEIGAVDEDTSEDGEGGSTGDG